MDSCWKDESATELSFQKSEEARRRFKISRKETYPSIQSRRHTRMNSSIAKRALGARRSGAKGLKVEIQSSYIPNGHFERLGK